MLKTDFQVGDIFISERIAMGEKQFRTRMIKPVIGMVMVRFDIDIDLIYKRCEISNVMFYKRGDKYAESRAIDGDTDA